MRKWLKNLVTRWNNWVGDRHLELAIRDRMVAQGLPRSALIRNVRLSAIERPGWVQIYRFEVSSSDESGSPWRMLGVARDDGRASTQVRLFHNQAEADTQFATWSEGLILAPRERR